MLCAILPLLTRRQIDKDVLRIGKVTSSPFSDDGKMTVFYHAPCMFESYVVCPRPVLKSAG